MSAALRLEGVVKSFGPTIALDGLELEARHGEVHGFLGPNGAGKTVTLRVLLGLLRQDSGHVELLGGDPWRDAVELHRRVAYVPGELNLWPQLSGGEVIDVLGRLQGGIDPRRRDDLVERFDLDVRRKARTYSKGNRQKVALVAALAADVDLYLLDEPTAGLDPLMEAVFQDCVGELAGQGRSVLLSSHILDQVEHLCDRVTIIRRGRTIQTGTLEELRHLTRTTVSVLTSLPLTGLDQRPGVYDVVVAGDGRVTFDVDSAQLEHVMTYVAGHGITALTSHPPTLEELFLRHYGDELSGAGLPDDGDRTRQHANGDLAGDREAPPPS